MTTTAELNQIAEDVARQLDEMIGTRKLAASLRGSLFLHIEQRARVGLQPAVTGDVREIIERFARPRGG